MSLYVHFGAGNIGRALAGPIFNRAGYKVVFVDAFPPVVDALHHRGEYRIVVKDEGGENDNREIVVSGVDAVAVGDCDALKDLVVKADLVGTAVGSAHIESVLKSMVPGILARNGRPLSIIFCENFNGVAEFARAAFKKWLPQLAVDEMIGFVETSIGKMVPLMPKELRDTDPLLVWAEAYNQIIADRRGFVGDIPDGIEGLVLKDCFQAYVERKLFIHNLGHATCACYGFLNGYQLISEAIADECIAAHTRALMMECATALIQRWPTEFNVVNQHEHVEDLIRRFGNRALGDTVYRVGRDLFRKLAPNDRFIGALRLIQSVSGDCSLIYKAIAAALCFKGLDNEGNLFPADAEFHDQLELDGVDYLLQSHCGLNTAECREVARYYNES